MARLPVYLRILLELAERARRHDLVRAAGRAGRRERRQGAQGPLLPRLLRHPRRRLRRRVPAVPDEPRARPHPRLAGRHRRRRQPRPGPRQLRRLRRAGLPRRRAGRRRPGQGRHAGRRGTTVRHLDDLPEIVRPSARTPSASSPPRPAAAQEVADRLVAAGVTSILNFAPAVLTVPAGRLAAQGRPRRRAADPELLPAASPCVATRMRAS